jgi:hypothetical protein
MRRKQTAYKYLTSTIATVPTVITPRPSNPITTLQGILPYTSLVTSVAGAVDRFTLESSA